MFEDDNDNMDGINDALPIGKKITLHRIPTVNKVSEINVNLEFLKKNMQSKKIAQKLYYENQGRSPLLRENATENKLPVHARLGTKGRKKMTYNFNPNLRNKNKPNRKNNNIINMKKNLAQERLQRIRQQRMAGHIFNTPSLPQKLRLRRNFQSNPINYKILVKNEIACNNMDLPKIHSIHGSLTNHLQDEIKIIQHQNIVEPNIIPNAPIITVGYGYTGTSMNNRFTLLP